MPRKATPPKPKPDHIHRLVPHCANNPACPWVACSIKGCGFYGTLDGSKVAYRDGTP